MSPIEIGLVAFVVLIILILAGIPVAVSLGLVGISGIAIVWGFQKMLYIASSLPYYSMASYSLAVIPLFYMMGDFAAEAGIAASAYKSARKVVSGFSGGLAMATVLGSAFFGAVCGSSLATASMFTRIAMPEMTKYGYDRTLSLGAIAGAATFAIMIPPSVTMIIYGVIVEESIGRLLIAGIFPGIITAVVYMLSIFVRVRWLNPSLAPIETSKFSNKERLVGLGGLSPIAGIFILLIGGLYLGWFTPSAAGAIGACATLVSALTARKLTWGSIGRVSLETARNIGSILVILVGGFFFARFLIASFFPQSIIELIASVSLNRYVIIALLALMYIILGCIMDPIPMIVCTVPFVYPLIRSVGFDGVWFGVILVKLTEIGCVTPPIGVNLYAVQAAAPEGTDLMDVIKGIFPFVLLDILILPLFIFFPEIILYLPSQMVH